MYTTSNGPMYVYIHVWTRTAHMQACLSTRTNTYLQTHIHTHKLKYTLLFFLCHYDTLFENRVFNWKLIVGILWICCLFAWCYETRKSILHPGREVCVCVALFYYTDIGESLRSRGQFLTAVDLGWPDLTLHLNYIAGYTGPLLFKSSSNGPSNYSVDNHGLVPWRLRRLGRSKFRSASLVRVLSDENGPSGTESQSLSVCWE